MTERDYKDEYKKFQSSKKMINKYDILRQDLLRYLIANETAVKAELNK